MDSSVVVSSAYLERADPRDIVLVEDFTKAPDLFPGGRPRWYRATSENWSQEQNSGDDSRRSCLIASKVVHRGFLFLGLIPYSTCWLSVWSAKTPKNDHLWFTHFSLPSTRRDGRWMDRGTDVRIGPAGWWMDAACVAVSVEEKEPLFGSGMAISSPAVYRKWAFLSPESDDGSAS